MSHQVILEARQVGISYRQRCGLLRYERFWGLKDVSFSLRAGETLGIIGSNGAGKSTLLRMIAGIIAPDRGSLWRHPHMSASLLALNAGLKPELSGRENAIISGLLLGMRRRDITDLLGDIRAFSGLGDFFERPVGSYSTGMRARLGFAVAIHADPDVLLIDEVLGVGDHNFKAKSHAAIKEKIRSNKTVVLVSHSMAAIRSLSDRVLWIEQGRSIACDEPNYVIDGYFESLKLAVKAHRAQQKLNAPHTQPIE
ncbi:MAG: ABC transporter ATP-binding protein [Pseudomonadaceae bacterium]|nr:ABC transporter ATP-binding protein [Pseudomonadaceae bacterium]